MGLTPLGMTTRDIGVSMLDDTRTVWGIPSSAPMALQLFPDPGGLSRDYGGNNILPAMIHQIHFCRIECS